MCDRTTNFQCRKLLSCCESFRIELVLCHSPMELYRLASLYHALGVSKQALGYYMSDSHSFMLFGVDRIPRRAFGLSLDPARSQERLELSWLANIMLVMMS